MCALNLSDQQQDWFIETIRNPATWAEAFLKHPDNPQEHLKLRSYQREVLESSPVNKNMSLLQGRRCLTGDMPVLMSDGSNKFIKDIKVGDKVVSRKDNGNTIHKKVTDIFSNGKKEIYKIKLSDSREIKCTSNHPLLVSKNYSYRGPSYVWDTIDNGLKPGKYITVLLKEIDKLSRTYKNKIYGAFSSSKIKSIEKIGIEETYDISVKDTHNFTVNGIVTHNSGKSVVLCADALWWTTAQPLVRLFDENGTRQVPIKVLILTPMDSQIKMLFDTILALCEDSPYIRDMVTKIKRSDVNEIHFSNGSVIKGMTIGISSANKGTSVRGLSADYLLIDEMDYIPRDIMEQSILPITSTNRECRMRICSTPTGKRELFYEYNTRKELGWWTIRIPSWHKDNPSWISIKECEETGKPLHESTEYQYRSVMDHNSYMREFGAEFGEELRGVYKNDLVNKSLIKYCDKYDAHDTSIFDPGFTQNPENKYIIGVDWNSYVNGGQIVLIEYCSARTKMEYVDSESGELISIDCTGKFRLFYRKGVKIEDGTQRATREEILRLLKTYKIDYLYVDYGYGDTNIEELTHFGSLHPEYGIKRKLHTVDSGSNIEHYDPILKKMVKKRAKSLMVNTGVVCLEEGRLLLPKEEDTKQRLISQMRGYNVKTVTIKGDYTYEGEDHILDAFNLAIWGFHHQYSNLLNTRYEHKIKFMNTPQLNNAPSRQSTTQSPILGTENKNVVDPDKPINKPMHGRNFGYTRGSRQLGGSFRRTF